MGILEDHQLFGRGLGWIDDNPQAGRYRTALSAPGAEHAVPLVRLRPETTYDYTSSSPPATVPQTAARPPGRAAASPPARCRRERRAARRDVEYARDLGLIARDAPVRVANPIYAEVIGAAAVEVWGM